jgi:hypothetical protein
MRFRSQFGDCLIQSLLIATGNGDFSALGYEKASGGKSNATVASRNECSFAREFHDSSSMMVVN